MCRKCYVRLGLLAVLSLGYLLQGSAATAEDLKARDIVRIAAGSHVKPQQILALDYEVLVMRDAVETAVDPSSYKFRVGDTFRVRIKPATNAYVYFFYEGTSGKTDCLLPRDGETAPRCVAGQVIELPDDGTVFQFTDPPGKENLIVVAANQPVADLNALSGKVFKTKGGSKALETIKAEASGDFVARGVLSSEGLEEARKALSDPERPKKVVIVDKPNGQETSTFVASVSSDENKRNDLVVEIPLVSGK